MCYDCGHDCGCYDESERDLQDYDIPRCRHCRRYEDECHCQSLCPLCGRPEPINEPSGLCSGCLEAYASAPPPSPTPPYRGACPCCGDAPSADCKACRDDLLSLAQSFDGDLPF